MSFSAITTRLIASLLISTLLLAGCGPGRGAGPVVSGPILSDPPPAVIDALEVAGLNDPDAAAWVIDLDRFLQKQDVTYAGNS